MARLAGASTITVFDIVPEKLELALENGADYALNSAEEGVAERAYRTGRRTL
ncbi:MAG: zinc-binding dehydrogenase [[Clostridium] scindens]